MEGGGEGFYPASCGMSPQFYSRFLNGCCKGHVEGLIRGVCVVDIGLRSVDVVLLGRMGAMIELMLWGWKRGGA